MNALDSSSPIPLYYQLKAEIQERIESGQWKTGDRVPSESELGDIFHVSRTTIRQALGDLVSQGLLTRARGRGTFVAQPRIQQPLTRLTGFTQDMRSRGKRAGSKVLQFEVTQAPGLVAKALRILPGEQVILLQRLRIANDVPMAIETSFLDYSRCKELLGEDLTQGSVYNLLSSRMQVIPTVASQQMEAVACPKPEAALLEIPKGAPVLHIFRTTFDQNGIPFERVESYYRGDQYIFYAELSALGLDPLSADAHSRAAELP